MSVETAYVKKKQFPECFLFEGKIYVPQELALRIEKRIQLHSKKPAQEWICALCGERRFIDDRLVEVVTDFFTLPSYNVDKDSRLVISLLDIKKIADEGYYIIAILHTHPHEGLEELWPSPSDIATAISIDALLGRPLKYIIVDKDGNKLFLTFENCFKCENSFFNFLFKQKGGEKVGKYKDQEGWKNPYS